MLNQLPTLYTHISLNLSTVFDHIRKWIFSQLEYSMLIHTNENWLSCRTSQMIDSSLTNHHTMLIIWEINRTKGGRLYHPHQQQQKNRVVSLSVCQYKQQTIGLRRWLPY